MAHHRTYFHSQHLRSPFRNLYSHLSLSLVPRLSLSPPSASSGSTLHLSIPDPQSAFSLSQQMHDFSKSPSSLGQITLLGRFPSSLHSPFPISTHSHTAFWAVLFQPPFSIPDLHSLAHCPLGGSLPASILHSRSPFARIYFYFCSR